MDPITDATPARWATVLEARGMRVRRFVAVTDADHDVRDVAWNQRDLLHVSGVHGGFDAIPAVVEDDRAALLFLQRFAGLRWPLSTVHWAAGPGCHRYYTTVLLHVVLIESAFTARPDGGTRVTATFVVAAPRWLAWTLPLLCALLRRNHERLDAEDAPIRSRRSELRGWGFRFEQDDLGPSYRRSLDLARDHVVAPAAPAAPIPEVLHLAGATSWRTGRSDHLGLRVERTGGSLAVYPRLCTHDGACLDDAHLEGERLVCPWHGRRVAALATVALDGTGAGEAATACGHELELDADGATLSIRRR